MRDRSRKYGLHISSGAWSAATVALLCLACARTAPAQISRSDDPLSGSIRIVGTDTMKDLMDRWIAAFTALHPEVHVELRAKGALTAAPALADGSADLAPLGREFTPSELAAFRSGHAYDPTSFPVALGSYKTSGRTVALAIVVNQSNPISHLSFQELDAVYCTSLRRGAAQLAPLSRELNPSEVAAFRAKHGYAPTEVAVALGSYRTPTRTVALTFYVNDANPINQLNLQELDAMWCTTLRRGAARPIAEWGQLGLGGEWAHRPIHLVGVLPPDGVPNFITRRVCSGGLLRDAILGEKNGSPTSVLTRIVEDVAKDPNAIGYAGFHNRRPGTHPLLIAETGAGPYYAGTFDEVRTATYPLTRFVYIYVDRPPNSPLTPAVREFLDYILSFEGQSAVQQEGIFMPLPPRIAAEQRSKIR